jgi:hypothetical protein
MQHWILPDLETALMNMSVRHLVAIRADNVDTRPPSLPSEACWQLNLKHRPRRESIKRTALARPHARTAPSGTAGDCGARATVTSDARIICNSDQLFGFAFGGLRA